MRIRDHELDPAQAAPGQFPEERGPERLSLGRADVHAEHFPAAVGVHADRHDDGHRDDAPVLANLHVGRIDPEVGPLALDGPVEEHTHALVNLLAQARDLALRDARAAHCPHEVVHGAGRDALDVGLLDHGGERFLSHPARLQEAGEVAALAQLWDA